MRKKGIKMQLKQNILERIKQHAHFHWQNLNEYPGGKCGPAWKHGRCWLTLFDKFTINPEWCFKRLNSLGLGAEIDPVDARIMFYAGVGPDFYLSLGFPFSWMQWANDRIDNSIRVFDTTIWIHLWTNPYEWSNKAKWWKQRQWRFNFADFIFGARNYTKREIEQRDVVIPMPEGNYPAVITLYEAAWKRKRFPKDFRILRADVKPKDGIPHPGKGTMSYNCGTDATYGMTTGECTSIESAIGQMVESVLRSRARYGGKDWKPKESEIPKSCVRR